MYKCVVMNEGRSLNGLEHCSRLNHANMLVRLSVSALDHPQMPLEVLHDWVEDSLL